MKRVKKVSKGSWLESSTVKRNEGILQDSDARFTAGEFDARVVKPEGDRVILPGEMITGMNGCPTAVRALRECFWDLLYDYADSRITSRLMQGVAEIYRRSPVGESGKRSVLFSKEKRFLATFITFHTKRKWLDEIMNLFDWSLSDSRAEASLKMKDWGIKNRYIPNWATHFKIIHHLSIVSDYVYSSENWRYEPTGRFNGLSVMGLSDYVSVWKQSEFEIELAFPKGVMPGEGDSVIQCFGIQFFTENNGVYYTISTGACVMLLEVY
jgi:hypothetical protein